jgi:hypothetical protein
VRKKVIDEMEQYILFKSERLTYNFITGFMCAWIVVDIIKNKAEANKVLIILFLIQFVVKFLARYILKRKMVTPSEK